MDGSVGWCVVQTSGGVVASTGKRTAELLTTVLLAWLMTLFDDGGRDTFRNFFCDSVCVPPALGQFLCRGFTPI